MTPLLMIDPGHGGIDPGGGSNDLFQEKDMVLKISLYQYRRFQELNVPVAITRQDDVTLGSEKRTAIVKNSGVTYCLSNHVNAGGGRGAEAIYSIYASATLSKNIVEELAVEGMPTRRIFTRTLPNHPKLDYYFMHRETGNVETVIVEYGFADNPHDAQKIATDWQSLAEAVVRAFCQSVKLPYQPPTTDGAGDGNEFPAWKREAVEWMYTEGLLTNPNWRQHLDEPLPLWAEAIVLRRLYEKIKG